VVTRKAMLMIAMTVAVGACRQHDRQDEPARSTGHGLSYAGSLDPNLPDGRDLTISAGVSITDGLVKRVETELGVAARSARTCMEGIYGTAWTDIELDRTGKVTRAAVRKEGLLAGTPIGACIEDALKTMQIGVVEGAPIRIGYPVRNTPSAKQIKEAAEILKGL